jgi:hypothetical protein
MTAVEAHEGSTDCSARAWISPAGEVRLEPGDGASVYGRVELAWFPDRLEVRAIGAGRVSIAEQHAFDDDQDVVVQLRPPGLDELPELVPGAD